MDDALPIPVRRPLVSKDVRNDLRRLATNAEGFRQRAFKHRLLSSDPVGGSYDEGYGQALTDVLSWLTGSEPTAYLTEAVAD
jgi:hypothetical protein